MAVSDSDRLFLRAALELAARGLYSAPPNPKVGCLFVREGSVLGRGWHEHTGGPHAEVAALTDAGGAGAVAGATCYVSLEPCAHHGRTPPCANALVEAGIARVVAAAVDPNPDVDGEGFDILRRAGIEVDVVESASARELNRGYLSQMERHRPWVRLKVASSIDGRTAMASGESQWITSAPARADVQNWRARSLAVVTGIGTVLADDPSMNVRVDEHARQPLRVVVDSQLRIPAESKMLRLPGDVLIAVADPALPDSAGAQDLKPAEIVALGHSAESSRVDLVKLLDELLKRDCNEVLIEAGAELTGAFLEAGLWDELIIYQAPKVLGSEARGLAALDIEALADAIEGFPIEMQRFQQDLRIRLLRSEREALHYSALPLPTANERIDS